MTSLVIEGRYNGPAGSGNGGWTAGSIARLLDAPAGTTVTLRVPPPLDTPMSAEREGEILRVYGPDRTLIADAVAAPLDVEPIDGVGFAEAVEISAGYPGFVAHPFPTCFVCGPNRPAGDGMRLFSGRLPDGRTATPWTVPDDVSPVMAWAALDCPGGWAVGIEARRYVLGRISARLDAVPAPGDACVVMGVMTSSKGRKAHVATTLYGPDRTVLARSEAIWIAIG